MYTSLEWKIVVGQRWFTSGHRTVGGEEEDRNNHGGTNWRTSWKAETRKQIWQKIDIFGVWEGVNDSCLYRYRVVTATDKSLSTTCFSTNALRTNLRWDSASPSVLIAAPGRILNFTSNGGIEFGNVIVLQHYNERVNVMNQCLLVPV